MEVLHLPDLGPVLTHHRLVVLLLLGDLDRGHAGRVGHQEVHEEVVAVVSGVDLVPQDLRQMVGVKIVVVSV